jgi:hypothetical protein
MSNENSTSNAPRTSRYIGCILYTDNEVHKEIINDMSKSLRCVGAYHDMDIDDNGELKKPHYHFITKFDVPSTEGSLLKLFPNIEENLCFCIKSFKAQARYLLHLDDADKHLYDDNALIGNISLVRRHIMTQDRQNEGMRKIQNFIRLHKIIDLNDVLDFVDDNDLWSSYKAYTSTVFKLLQQSYSDIIKNEKNI